MPSSYKSMAWCIAFNNLPFTECRTSVSWLQREHLNTRSNLLVFHLFGVGGTNKVDIVKLKGVQVSTDEDGFLLQPTLPGSLMAQHYISFRTFVAMLKAEELSNLQFLRYLTPLDSKMSDASQNQVPEHASIPDLLMILAASAEFGDIKLRRCFPLFLAIFLTTHAYSRVTYPTVLGKRDLTKRYVLGARKRR